jgi:hypothetical protein
MANPCGLELPLDNLTRGLAYRARARFGVRASSSFPPGHISQPIFEFCVQSRTAFAVPRINRPAGFQVEPARDLTCRPLQAVPPAPQTAITRNAIVEKEKRQTVAHVLMSCRHYKDLLRQEVDRYPGRKRPQNTTKAIRVMEQTWISGQDRVNNAWTKSCTRHWPLGA